MRGPRTATRIEKLRRWLWYEPAVGTTLHPRPWSEPGTPYFVQNELDDPDGHGGYTRLYEFGPDGVPFTRRRSGEAAYDPLVIARYARRMLAIAHARGSREHLDRARRMLAPLLESGAAGASWARGQAPNAMSGRPHANVQGEVISALLRLSAGKPDAAVLSMLGRARDVLLRAEEDGGTRSSIGGRLFLEEYPGTRVRHVLGGCITGLYGLYDLADALGDETATRAAGELEQSLVEVLPLYMLRFGWSLYALDVYGDRYLASSRYHESRLMKLTVIAQRSPQLGLGTMLARWEHALHHRPTRLAAAAAKSAQVLWHRYVRRHPLWEG